MFRVLDIACNINNLDLNFHEIEHVSSIIKVSTAFVKLVVNPEKI